MGMAAMRNEGGLGSWFSVFRRPQGLRDPGTACQPAPDGRLWFEGSIVPVETEKRISTGESKPQLSASRGWDQ